MNLQMQPRPMDSFSSPCSSTCSSATELAEMSATVVGEFAPESNSVFEDKKGGKSTEEEEDDDDDDDDDDEGGDGDGFDFSFVCSRESVSSPISADQIFHNGQIRPVSPPLFLNTDFTSSNPSTLLSTRACLKKLLFKHRDPPSSSEADDLGAVPPGTYCVWTPRAAAEKLRSWKSKLMGFSKRWKLRDLFRRNSSEGEHFRRSKIRE
ncbi:uncharacterized protein LOC127790664 [Diospyros lotus]|uniref:uncharacterized protein LOC127790664 n=1 Tax=Diospyros lotus TaxID=55363 RepID=UPI00224EAFE5|nr:uncharacterized protein LOC127790664 [Diospyros lotus]